MTKNRKVIVSGALANKPQNGGGIWERMSWVVGLQRLGFEVYFVEQISPLCCVNSNGNRVPLEDSVNLQWFRQITKFFGVENHSALIDESNNKCVEIDWENLLDIAESAQLLINLSGHLQLKSLINRISCNVYIDVDPGFAQFWHADSNTPFQLCGHDYYFTIGENIGKSLCPIPTCEIEWRHTRQPIVLDQWPVVKTDQTQRFTTIAGWRGPYGPINFEGKILGLKAHEFRKFIELPKKSLDTCFELALSIHPSDEKDRLALVENGWNLVDPNKVANTHDSFQHYVQNSSAEFSVAQGVYVETNSGWFSDRSIRYLASGKPVLLQDTGFSENYPVGSGIIPFSTMEQAITGANQIAMDYKHHCNAARQIAEEFFNSDKVLSHLLKEVGITL
jgi:hypothetical protein